MRLDRSGGKTEAAVLSRPDAIPRACFVKRIDGRNPLIGLVEAENPRVRRPTSHLAPPNHVGLAHQQIDMILGRTDREW